MAEEAGRKASAGMKYAYAMLFTLLLGSAFINFFLIFSINSGLSSSSGDAKTPEPAKLSITLIKVAECDKCFSTDALIAALKAGGAEVTEKTLESESAEADALIEKYSIEKLPALVVYGEIEKAGVSSALGSGAEFDANTLVLRDVKPPYLDVKTNSVIGLVYVTLIKSSACGKCAGISGIVDELEQLKVGIGNVVEIDRNYLSDGNISETSNGVALETPMGSLLIDEYGIDRLPVAIVSKDLNAYPEITRQWANVGRLAYNGNYIADYAVPYFDINSNAVKGLVDVIKLTDAGCADCYDVNAHDAILARFGVGIGSETVYDISSADGNALVQKYSIKQVPTITLSGNAKEYKTLTEVWADVGSIEADGTYVFRDLNVMGVKFRTLD
ncbi:MAG: hypothetical protein HYW05_02865 [Candidatus Diapherotrites archaeon]|nr:hypothetical protein [Candidatus Diapherotrites archaeon]